MIIYHAYCLVSGKSYVGQTSRSLSLRWYDHVYQASRLKDHFHYAIRKYGKDSFQLQILSETEDSSLLDSLESLWILLLNTKSPNGYNLTSGGGGVRGWKASPEVCERISASKRGKPRPVGLIDKTWKTRKASPKYEEFRDKCREARKKRGPNRSRLIGKIA